MSKDDYKNLPDKVEEQKLLEDWVMSLVENNEKASISKKNFIKTIKENLKTKKNTVGTPQQNSSFEMVEEIVGEMTPPMTVIVKNFDNDGHLNGMVTGGDKNIPLNICPKGDIKLDGVGLGEGELNEEERDSDGEYIGAPVDTAPVKTPTIAPTKPGEKKRRGPFQNLK